MSADTGEIETALAAFDLQDIRVGQRYRHWKSGNIYSVVRLSLNEPDLTPLVSYCDIDNLLAVTWTRTLAAFCGYTAKNGMMVKRFERLAI